MSKSSNDQLCQSGNCPVTPHVGGHTPGIGWSDNKGSNENCDKGK